MPDLRPSVEQEQVLALLQQYYAEPVTDLALVEGGQIARTFAFRAGQQDYILRFMDANNLLVSFAKKEDEQAYQWTRDRILRLLQ